MDQYLNSLYVVLIEPSIPQQKIVIQQFEDLGIQQFEVVSTGQSGLDLIDSEQPDLVVSAMFLEDMTGRDVVLEMRSNPVTENIPFMLISTETSFRELDPIKQAGASAVLPKPFQVDDLKRAISMVLAWDDPEQIELENLDGLQVLLVDDSPLARKMISRTLTKMGLSLITEADDGRTALPLIQSNHYDLIITDYNMPQMDGHELLMFIRQKSKQKTVPVLMVTTEGNESVLSAIQHDGVSAIVDKPFDTVTVKQLIESALSQITK